jgi:hypothetical protein
MLMRKCFMININTHLTRVGCFMPIKPYPTRHEVNLLTRFIDHGVTLVFSPRLL